VRADLLEGVPEVVAYFSEGSAALAADFYDDEREAAGARGLYLAEPVIVDRAEKIRNAVAWAAAPLLEPSGDATPQQRLAEIVQYETARPYRDTITANRQRDPEAVGWRRLASGGCKFCQMLAGRGAVYRQDTARFASHTNCHCTAQPVFKSNDTGEEADVLQYVASKRNRTASERRQLREYLNDAPGGDGATRKDTSKRFGFDSLTKDQVSHQIGILSKLPDTEYKATQLARYRARLAEL
jgi:hypothetical protein